MNQPDTEKSTTDGSIAEKELNPSYSELVADAFAPMTPEELARFYKESKFRDADNMFIFARKPQSTPIKDDNPSESDEEIDQAALEFQIAYYTRWLSTITSPNAASIRDIASSAIATTGHGPFTRDELLSELLAFAIALFRINYSFCEDIASQHTAMESTSANETVTNAAIDTRVQSVCRLVADSPVQALQQLNKVETLLAENKKAAEVYLLFEFAYCSIAEIAGYLREPEATIKDLLLVAQFELI